jgi:hypothetical protein
LLGRSRAGLRKQPDRANDDNGEAKSHSVSPMKRGAGDAV